MGTLGTLIATRNLFVNSDDPLVGECRDVTYNLPQNVISCRESQHMRITLNAFSMRNSWYRVNRYNNAFFLLVKFTEASNRFSARATLTLPLPVVDQVITWGADGTAGAGVFKAWAGETQTQGRIEFTKTSGVAPTAGIVIGTADAGTQYTVAAGGVSRVAGYPVRIPPANYTSFESLCNAIESELQLISKNSIGAAAGGIEFIYQSVTWDSQSNKIEIVVKQPTAPDGEPDPDPVDVKFVCYTISPYVANSASLVTEVVGRFSNSAFQNSYELVGGCFQKTVTTGTFEEQFDATRSLFVIDGNVHKSSYNATLQTEENIYLRTNLHSPSYQTAGFDTGCTRYPQILSSQILAKIPLNNPQFAVTTSRAYPFVQKLEVPSTVFVKNQLVEQGTSEGFVKDTVTGTEVEVNVVSGAFRSTAAGGDVTFNAVKVDVASVDQQENPYTLTEYERPYELVQYTDNGDNMYSIMLQEKKVTNLRLYITDSYGRLWPEISAAQIECNAMPFTASFRIDVFQE